jgi:5-methylcytosine-specific restriction endonuclease McrA
MGSNPIVDMKLRNYTKEMLAEAAAESISVAGVCKYLGINNPGGSSQTNMRNRLRAFGIDTSHFLGKAARKGMVASNRLTAAEILVRLPQGAYRAEAKKLRRALIEIGRAYRCEVCGNEGTWLDADLTLEVHHRDGDWHNNEPDNLRFLCPNCHTQH